MIVRETESRREIKQILSNDEINDRLSSDDGGVFTVDTLPINENYRYIGGYLNDEIFALCIYCRKDHYTVMHFHVLPGFRLRHARQFAKQALSMKDEQPLYAITPSCYRPVVNFAVKMGFEIQGIHDDSFLKNGVEYEQIVTRFNDGCI